MLSRIPLLRFILHSVSPDPCITPRNTGNIPKMFVISNEERNLERAKQNRFLPLVEMTPLLEESPSFFPAESRVMIGRAKEWLLENVENSGVTEGL